MKLRPTLPSSAIAGLFTLGVTALGMTACGDDRQNVTTLDAGNALSPTDTFESDNTSDGVRPIDETSEGAPITGIVPPPITSNESSAASASSDESATSVQTEASSASSAAPLASSNPSSSETTSETSAPDTTVVIEPCNVPLFSVFTRSDTDASWDDNDFSSVDVDSSQCPPAVYVNATWPHEADWANGDPSEANHEQVHFTLDSYGATNLVDKEITATVELVADERGPNANAGGYLVSIVSVSTFDRVTVIPTAGEADAGPDASPPEPQVITETGYSEAESDPKDRILLRRVGDRATVSFRVPAKTEAVDSYDPERVLKLNLRFYNVYEGLAPVGAEPLDAGAGAVGDAGADAAVSDQLAPLPEGDPSLVYDYLSSRFAITKFTVSDVAGVPAP